MRGAGSGRRVRSYGYPPYGSYPSSQSYPNHHTNPGGYGGFGRQHVNHFPGSYRHGAWGGVFHGH